MIKAAIRRDGWKFSLDVTGHADPVVCSGVSTLCQTLYAWALNSAQYAKIEDFSGESGDFHIKVTGRAETAFCFVALGLLGIHEAHKDQISIDENFFESLTISS